MDFDNGFCLNIRVHSHMMLKLSTFSTKLIFTPVHTSTLICIHLLLVHQWMDGVWMPPGGSFALCSMGLIFYDMGLSSALHCKCLIDHLLRGYRIANFTTCLHTWHMLLNMQIVLFYAQVLQDIVKIESKKKKDTQNCGCSTAGRVLA